MRADQLLVQRGLAASRSQAQRLIAAGLRWRVGGGAWQTAGKSGAEVPLEAELQLADDAEARYVSRGGLKLEGALHAAALDVRGRRCLDVGQSTGGFTHCLLQRGAAHVTGVDVGHGQLHPSLAADARVRCIEGVNARHLTADVAGSGFEVIVGDVSFISLTLIFPALAPLLADGGHVLMLVKPQFELQPGEIGKGGVVRDETLYAKVRQKMETACAQQGWRVLHWLPSPICGGDGNREFFIHTGR